ncbi:uncharacterized protein LOC126368334 [Pectinophora gossypiella]|uniref:uncharacterized protein LOC126368334 n=1 Tax=Pectinophora gossypiella TaxID=13191 RepID=UPI00214DF23F|nr:uncharacterized protein LOC126368334 [Pectinophora gossypiella]
MLVRVTNKGAMLWMTMVLLAGVCGGSAEYSARCSKEAQSSVTVTASPDGVRGRYVVEYCALVDEQITQWELVMNTLTQPKENCSYQKLQEKYSGTSHSHNLEYISPLKETCPYVCYSRPMDLMFRSCYRLQNKLIRGEVTTEPYNSYFFADNNITEFSPDTLTQFTTDIDYDTTVSFHWLEGHIPITEYEITVWPNASHNGEETVVTRNCSRTAAGGAGLRCELRLPLGCYTLQLKHIAPWTKGYHQLAFAEATFCHSGSSPPRLRRAGGAALWWGCGVGALLAVLLAALLARRLRHDAKARIYIWQRWIDRQAEADEKPAGGGEGGEGGGRVLLLYAREGAAAGRLARALARLLRGARLQVYDVHSPEVTALAARGPAGWVRAALAARCTRVLLLQTPALHALLHHRAGPDKPHSPLLPRVRASRPAFGDTLLQYALTLLAETAGGAAQPYHKYYLATLSELPVDVFPCLVPYTRFLLPEAAQALVQALFPGSAPQDSALAEVNQAAAEFVQYVRDHPNYLADELVFLPPTGDS